MIRLSAQRKPDARYVQVAAYSCDAVTASHHAVVHASEIARLRFVAGEGETRLRFDLQRDRGFRNSSCAVCERRPSAPKLHQAMHRRSVRSRQAYRSRNRKIRDRRHSLGAGCEAIYHHTILGVAGMADDAMTRSNTMSSPKPNNHSCDQTRELSAHEVCLVSGTKVLENSDRADHHPAEFRQRLLGGLERQGPGRRRLSKVTRRRRAERR
jgi:hypothetical protein